MKSAGLGKKQQHAVGGGGPRTTTFSKTTAFHTFCHFRRKKHPTLKQSSVNPAESPEPEQQEEAEQSPNTGSHRRDAHVLTL